MLTEKIRPRIGVAFGVFSAVATLLYPCNKRVPHSRPVASAPRTAMSFPNWILTLERMPQRNAILVGVGGLLAGSAVCSMGIRSLPGTFESGVSSAGYASGGATRGQPKTTSHAWRVANDKLRESRNMDPIERWWKTQGSKQ